MTRVAKTLTVISHQRGRTLLTVLPSVRRRPLPSERRRRASLPASPRCRSIAGGGSAQSVFGSRGFSLLPQPGAALRLLLPGSPPRGIRASWPRKDRLSAAWARGASPRAQGSLRPTTRFAAGAEGDHGHGALLGARGQAAPRPLGQLDLLRRPVVLHPHQHALGRRRAAPRPGGGGSVRAAARSPLFPR